MKKIMMLGVLALAFTFLPNTAFAGCGCKASPWTEKESYGDKMTGKLEFGLKNLLGGWTALFSTPAKYQNEDKCVLKGTGVGLIKGIIYEIGGALHTVTFPIPIDVPLPDGGVSFD